MLFATIAVVLAGAIVAAVLLFATSKTEGPRRYQPFAAGDAVGLKGELRDGGPFFVPDPFGGNRSILFALEDNQIVALSNVLPGTHACSVRWRGSIDRFVDCHGDRFVSAQLDRYEVTIPKAGTQQGSVLVDLRHKLPAPSPAA